MTSDIELIKKIITTDITLEEINEFLNSVVESVTYTMAGMAFYHLLLKIERERLFPILQKIKDGRLKFYKGIKDKSTIKKFIKGIKIEERIYEHPEKEKIIVDGKKYHALTALNRIIFRRAKIFIVLFEFTEEDLNICRERADKLLQDKKEKKLKDIQNRI